MNSALMVAEPLFGDTMVLAPPNAPRKLWDLVRRDGVGGSDIGPIAGLSRWSSPYEIWLDKTGQRVERRNPVLDRKARMGQRLEPVIADMFAEELGVSVYPIGTLARIDAPWMRVNLDRVVAGCPDGPCFVEVKNRSEYFADLWEADQEIPDDTACQAHWGMAVGGASHAHVAVLIGGWDLRLFRLERDEDLLADLALIGHRFWQRVLSNTPPPLGPTTAEAELINRVYSAAHPDVAVEVDMAEARFWRAQRERAIADGAQADADRREAETRMKAFLGNATVAVAGGQVAWEWSKVTSSRVDMDRLKTEYPEVYADCLVTGSHRRLNVPEYRKGRR